jgi:hypothetical protein
MIPPQRLRDVDCSSAHGEKSAGAVLFQIRLSQIRERHPRLRLRVIAPLTHSTVMDDACRRYEIVIYSGVPRAPRSRSRVGVLSRSR